MADPVPMIPAPRIEFAIFAIDSIIPPVACGNALRLLDSSGSFVIWLLSSMLAKGMSVLWREECMRPTNLGMSSPALGREDAPDVSGVSSSSSESSSNSDDVRHSFRIGSKRDLCRTDLPLDFAVYS